MSHVNCLVMPARVAPAHVHARALVIRSRARALKNCKNYAPIAEPRSQPIHGREGAVRGSERRPVGF